MALRRRRSCASMKARCGSHAEMVAGEAGGRGGGICGRKPVDTPGDFAATAAAKRFWYARMVLRSMPVTRSISRWLAPVPSKVQMVVCRCGFKTFTPCLPSLCRGRRK
jgi:hypothetical protein